jgi:NAD-dependent dihydropyrimidine dehydrogenase PreA subunit
VSNVAENLFIDVKVADSAASDVEVTKRLIEACPVDIFAADDDGSCKIVAKNLDECVLCYLCVEAAPEGTVEVLKLYE